MTRYHVESILFSLISHIDSTVEYCHSVQHQTHELPSSSESKLVQSHKKKPLHTLEPLFHWRWWYRIFRKTHFCQIWSIQISQLSRQVPWTCHWLDCAWSGYRAYERPCLSREVFQAFVSCAVTRRTRLPLVLSAHSEFTVMKSESDW